MESIFPETKKFRFAVNLINDLEARRFPLVLTRILKNLDSKGAAVFTNEEKEQLQELLSLTAADLSTLIEACAFVFERSAYYQLKPADLGSHLSKVELIDEKVRIFFVFKCVESLNSKKYQKTRFTGTDIPNCLGERSGRGGETSQCATIWSPSSFGLCGLASQCSSVQTQFSPSSRANRSFPV